VNDFQAAWNFYFLNKLFFQELSPNPINDKSELIIYSKYSEKMKLEILSITGQLIRAYALDIVADKKKNSGN